MPATLAGDTDRLARFEREAQLLASLNHAYIASVHGLDEHEGTLYIAMELVEGETLEEKLKSGALPVEHALRLGLQIAEALEAAHENGRFDSRRARPREHRDGERRCPAAPGRAYVGFRCLLLHAGQPGAHLDRFLLN